MPSLASIVTPPVSSIDDSFSPAWPSAPFTTKVLPLRSLVMVTPTILEAPLA